MEASSNSEASQPQPALPPRKRRRWWLIVLVLFVALVALVLLLPYGIALDPVRKRIEDQVSAQLRGKCRIQSLGFSWSSGISADGIEIDNPPGFTTERPCLRLKHVTADVSLGSLLSGPYAVTADFEGLEVFVEQNADGTTNLQQLAANPTASPAPTPQPTPPTGPEPEGTGGPPAGAPVHLDFQLRNSLIEIRRQGVVLEELRDLQCRAYTSGDSRIKLEGKATLLAGGVDLDCEFDAATGTADAKLISRGLDLASWQPLLDTFMPDQVSALAGKVDGELLMKLTGKDRIEVGGELIVVGPRLRGPIVKDMDLRSERWTITPLLTLGTGAAASVDTSRFSVDLGWLQLRGKPATPGGNVAFTYAVDLARLAEFGGPMPASLKGTGSKLTGIIELPATDLPADAAGWAKAVIASADLQVARFDIAGMSLRDVAVTATARDGACVLSTGQTTKLDGGTLLAGVQLDLLNLDELPATVSLKWQGGQLTGSTTALLRYAMPLFAGLDASVATVVGNCDLTLDVTGPCMKPAAASWLTWFDNWSGSGSLGLRDAGFAPAGQLQSLLAPLGPLSQGSVPISENGRLVIDSFQAPFEFAKGHVKTTTAEWLAKGQRIGLSGTVALDGKLDYALDLSALLKGHKDGERVLKVLNGALPAARLAGSLDSPTLGLPDLGNIAQKLLEQQGKDLLQKGINDLLKKIK